MTVIIGGRIGLDHFFGNWVVGVGWRTVCWTGSGADGNRVDGFNACGDNGDANVAFKLAVHRPNRG